MTSFKKFSSRLGGCLCLLAVYFSTCEKVPDFCGEGQLLDPATQFCFESRTYDKCGGVDYSPVSQICEGSALKTKCADGRSVPLGTPCGGYTLTTSTTPAAGGSIDRNPDAPSYTAGTLVAVTATPANGYAFKGWEGASASAWPSIVITMDGDKSLVAMFTPITYTLAVNRDPVTGGSVTGGGTFTEGTNAAITATVNSGYTFSGWTPAAGVADPSALNTTVSMTENRTVTANFDPIMLTLTVNRNLTEGGTVTPVATSDVAAGTPVNISATTALGYVFVNWTITNGTATFANANSASTTITLSSNTTITANFQQVPTYTLTVNRNPTAGGTVTPATQQTVTAGTPANISATAALGYTFANWTVTSGTATFANANNASTTVTLSSNATINANFQQVPTYTLTINRNPAEGGTVNPATQQIVTSGTPANISATAADGYAFANWTVANGTAIFVNANSASTTVSLSSNATITANFQQQQNPTYTLTVNRSPTEGGTVSLSPSGGNYTAGTQVTVTATAAEGYKFSGWTGSTSTSSAITITVNSSQTLIANFEQIPMYTLSTNASPTGGGTVSLSPSGGSYAAGTQVYVTATAAQGYTFSGWTGSTSTNTTVTVTVNSNTTLTANFKLIFDPNLQFNPNITYGSFTDSRDGRSYRTVVINGRRWMAENLNYTTANSWCYDNNESNCAKYGRLYTWNAATSACPAGWRLPNDKDWWYGLIEPVGGQEVAGGKLKSRTGWEPNGGESGNGTNEFGFSALSGGGYRYYGFGDFFSSIGYQGDWWTTWEGANSGIRSSMFHNSKRVVGHSGNANDTNTGCSVRCCEVYTLTVNRNPTAGGTVSLSPSWGNYAPGYAPGTQVTVTATPAPGYTFSGWIGSTSTNSTITVTMNSSQTLTANFQINPNIVFSSFTDSRDGRSYRTVKIGTQTWMAENLNYNASGSVCFNNSPDSCAKYGRLYDWNTVMGGASSSSSSPSGVRGVCPDGWHIPSDAEWHALVSHANPSCSGRPNDVYCDGAGTKLKSAGGWYTDDGYKAGTDEYGFSALPGGSVTNGLFYYTGRNGCWWSTTEIEHAAGVTSALGRFMYHNDEYVVRGSAGKATMSSARCIQDERP